MARFSGDILPPMSMMLVQQPTDLRLWEQFQVGRFSTEEIAANLVLRRWQRSRDAGLSGDNPSEPVMSLVSLAESMAAFAPLLAPGAPFDVFASVMAKSGYCGLFCDANGVILSRRISEPFDNTITRARLVEGAVWSEGARGTNGVGTTLEECDALSIIGAEHYELRNHMLACYAAPVRDIRERVVAVLDATGPVSAADNFAHASVVATAAALEALIIARTYDTAVPGGLFELERLLARLPHATLLVEMTGHVRRVNDRFRAMRPESNGADLARRVSSRLAANPEAAVRMAC